MNVSKLIQLKPEEEVVMVVHASLIPLWSKIVLAFLWLVLPFFLLFPLFAMHLFGVAMFIVLLVSGLVYAYRTFIMWHNTVFIITDRRIIDIDQRGLFSRLVSEASILQVQDVFYRIKGVWPTLFRYGTVTLRAEGIDQSLEVYNVRRPARVHDLINDLRNDHGEPDVLHP